MLLPLSVIHYQFSVIPDLLIMVEIHNEPISFDLHGVSGEVPDRNYAKAGFKLMQSLWPRIKETGIKTTGINYWVYRGASRLSTCVELSGADGSDILEDIPVRFDKYAYYKHIGPYDRLSDAYTAIKREIAELGLGQNGDYVEKYGHWTEDSSNLETEIFAGLK